MVFLNGKGVNNKLSSPLVSDKHTSSPTLKEFPPHPGNKTRSPAFTTVGIILPSLLGAPGPTAMTYASGRGLDVADVGKKIPAAVF